MSESPFDSIKATPATDDDWEQNEPALPEQALVTKPKTMATRTKDLVLAIVRTRTVCQSERCVGYHLRCVHESL